MLKDAILNISIIISFLFFIGLITRGFQGKRWLPRRLSGMKFQLAGGVLLGSLGLLLMFFSIKVNAQVIIDLRHLATVLAAAFIGGPAAVISAIMIGVSRILFGVSNVSVTAMLFMFAIGISCAYLTKIKISNALKFHLLNIVGTVISYIVIYINVGVFSGNKEILPQIYFYFGIASIIGGTLAYYVASYLFESIKLFVDLSKSNKELEKANAKFKVLNENINMGIIVEDVNREITLINKHFYEIFGLEKTDDHLELNYITFLKNAKNMVTDLESYIKRIDQIVTQKEMVLNESMKYSNGKIIERDYIPIHSPNGEFIGHLWNFRDVTKNKEYEEAIKHSEQKHKSLSERYESVVESIKEVVFTIDKNGNWSFLNRAWIEMTGFTQQESLNQPFTDYVHADDRETVQQLFNQLITREQKYCRHEIRILTKAGTFRWVEWYAKIKIDGEGHVMGASGTLDDITLRKTMEKKLAESEQQYKSLFKYNESATFTLDLFGHFQNINGAAEVITGYTFDDLVGSSFIPLICKSYLDQTVTHFNKVLHGESVTFETKITRKNGSDVYLKVNTAPIIIDEQTIGCIGIAHDITEQKEAEKKLLESEKRYRSLIDLSPEVIFVHSQSKIEYVNDKALSLLGVTDKTEIIGKTIFDFLHPEDKQKVAYNMTLGFNQPEVHLELDELRFMRANGEVVPAMVGAEIINDNGEPALLGIIHDISAQKESEKKLKEANEILLNLSKLDGLTGIPNRRYFDEVLNHEWNEAIQGSQGISFILLDIDHFKAYNDTYGHQQGDTCLKQVAQALKKLATTSNGFVARYGGEEFALILPRFNERDAIEVSKKLLSHIEGLEIPHEKSLVKPVVTISIGVTTIIPRIGMKEKELIDCADQALYQAKEQGRNTFVFQEMSLYEISKTE